MQETIQQPTVSVSSKNNNNKIYVLIIFVLGLCLVVTMVGIIVAFMLSKKVDVSITPTPTVSSSIAPTVTQVTNTDVPELFYLTDGGIYQYNVGGQTSKLLYSNQDDYIDTIFYAEQEYLTFNLRDMNGNISVYKLDIGTGTDTLIKSISLPASDSYMMFLWYQANKFSYLSQYSPDDGTRVKVKVINDDSLSKVETEFNKWSPQRGASYTIDSARGIVSPDRTKSLYSLSFATDIKDTHDTIIFNRLTNTVKEISNSTMSQWLDNNTVLYYSLVDDKWYKKDVNTNEVSIYTALSINMENVYGLHVIDNMAVYWKNKIEVYTFDMTTKVEKKILDDATSPTWLDRNHILYKKLEVCADMDLCPSGYTDISLYIYNLVTDSERLIVNDSIEYAHENKTGFYYCESITCSGT